MGGRTRAPYPPEYKAELVRLVREEGRSPSELAREFEPSAARLGSKPPSMPERSSVHLLRSLAFTARRGQPQDPPEWRTRTRCDLGWLFSASVWHTSHPPTHEPNAPPQTLPRQGPQHPSNATYHTPTPNANDTTERNPLSHDRTQPLPRTESPPTAHQSLQEIQGGSRRLSRGFSVGPLWLLRRPRGVPAVCGSGLRRTR